MARPWRVAGSLQVLLNEVNHRWPHRDKASDGSIGDIRHQAGWTASDHNPWVVYKGVGIVRARDFDSGPGLNPDEAHDNIGDTIAAAVVAAAKRGHPAMGDGSYVIWEHRIASAKSTPPWSWRHFDGDPHTSHPHVSVTTRQKGYDSTKPWGLWPVEEPKPAGKPPTLWMSMPKARARNQREWIKKAQRRLGVTADGVFGPSTRRHVIAYRKRYRLGRPLSVIGPKVWKQMGVK